MEMGVNGQAVVRYWSTVCECGGCRVSGQAWTFLSLLAVGVATHRTVQVGEKQRVIKGKSYCTSRKTWEVIEEPLVSDTPERHLAFPCPSVHPTFSPMNLPLNAGLFGSPEREWSQIYTNSLLLAFTNNIVNIAG